MSYQLAVLKSSENKIVQNLERWRREMTEKADEAKTVMEETEADIQR
jgi:hypothetical protein